MLGSGLSVPYLKTLSNIENWLTQCSSIQDQKARLILEDNLKMAYVEDVMKPCLFEYRQERKEDLSKVKHAYKDFWLKGQICSWKGCFNQLNFN